MTFDTHPDSDIFDEKYPPDEALERSDEYTDESQTGMYGRSEHDYAIVSMVDPLKVWSICEGYGGLYASPGFRVVNWLYWYVSSVPRDESEPDHDMDLDYQLTIEEDDGDDSEEHF